MPAVATRTDSVAIELMSSNHAGDEWVHLLPAGTFQGRDGRGPYKLDNPSAVIAASREQAGTRLMPIDYDHAIDLAAPSGNPAPAAGWIKGLQARSDGVWGLVDWTPRAAEQLAQREYRYLSPVFHHSADGTIKALLRASLTNNPNLDQLKALASMEATEMDKLAELKKSLGLPDDVSIDDILAEVNKLTTARQSAAPDLTQFVPIGDFERVVSEVNRLNQGISLQTATHYVNDQIKSAKLLPFLRDWGIALCTVNKPAFDQFVANTQQGIQRLLAPSGASASPPPDHGFRELHDNEIAIASNLGLTQEQFLKNKTARGTAQEY